MERCIQQAYKELILLSGILAMLELHLLPMFLALQLLIKLQDVQIQ